LFIPIILLALTAGAESPVANTIQVPADFPTIQLAINAAVAGDTILVAPGTYAETLLIDNLSLTIRSSGGANVTTIDASGLGVTAVRFLDGPTNPSGSFRGFTVSGGAGVDGGGLFSDIDLALRDCIFHDNQADTGGGASLRGFGSNAGVLNCTFADNTALFQGGGLYIAAIGATSSLQVDGCTFRDNQAADGGGAFVSRSTVGNLLGNCAFVSNEASGLGGGLYQTGGVPSANPSRVEQCLFVANEAGTGGGGLYTETLDDLVVNCTFFDNESSGDGGGLSLGGSGALSTKVVNCILWEDRASNSDPEIHGAPHVRYSLVQGVPPLNGNISLPPLFRDIQGMDFRLAPGSPAVDAGDNSAVAQLEDLGGGVRLLDDLGRIDTGLGTSPIVDMGAYEFSGNSTGFIPTLTLTSPPLQGGQVGSFGADQLEPNGRTLLFSTSLGTGFHFVPEMQLFLNLTDPHSFFRLQRADAAGHLDWTFLLPVGASGRTIWFQAGQFQLSTNVVKLSIL